MLDYENQMFLEVLEEDGLVITAKGLGLEDMFLNLLKVYSDPGNLVIVLGTTNYEEQFYIDQLTAEGVKPLPKIITGDSGTSQERMKLYLGGGVLFLSPRILVVDLLKDRLPIAQVTGILVYRAHSIIKSCQEAFAVRLYRQKNKTGFVKAFSNSPQSFTAGFSQVSRIMKILFLKQLYLWPRFQAIVQSSLSACKPLVTEMHVQLTPSMTRIQNSLLELMSFIVKELKRINPSMDFEELTVENAIAKSFHKILQNQLDPVWHRLSSKTKTLVADLKILRVFLLYLTHYDCISFYKFVSSFRSQLYVMNSSGWMLLDAANTMFLAARQRCVGTPKQETTAAKSKRTSTRKGKEKYVLEDKDSDIDDDLTSKSPENCQTNKKRDCENNQSEKGKAKYSKLSLSQKESKANKSADTEEENEIDEIESQEIVVDPSTKLPMKDANKEQKVDPEPSPKWLVLKQILNEIKDISKLSHKEYLKPDKVLILVHDKRTAKQLQDFLVYGARNMLLKLYERTAGHQSAAHSEPRSHRDLPSRPPAHMFENYKPLSEQKEELLLTSQMLSEDQSTSADTKTKVEIEKECSTVGSSVLKKDFASQAKAAKLAVEEYRDVYILSQRVEVEDKAVDMKTDDVYQLVAEKIEDIVDEDDVQEETPFQPPIIVIQTFKTNGNLLSLPQTLNEIRPRFIIMYDIEMSAIRRIEVYQSVLPSVQIQVYFVIFGGSVEEQAYLTGLRREKEAFEFLIREKSIMVIPADQDGKSDTCQALIRENLKPNETVNTRKGGGNELQQQPTYKPTIIVDMREFNSELPAMIHKHGIEIDPVTLQIGDYILSPDICVERKSISDLIGSLNNGRLYNQAKAMTRYYSNPMLLIEFDQNKPMTLLGNYYISNDITTNDVSSKLILLTLHFPQLKIVWSPNPYATAQLFEELKQFREEPDAFKAAGIGADLEQDLDISEKYNPAIHDLVSKLPGVTTKNIHKILNNAQSLDNLLTYTKEALTKLLGNGQDAQCLYDGLHKFFNQSDGADSSSTMNRRGRWRGRGAGFKKI